MDYAAWTALVDLLGDASEDPLMPGEHRDAIGELRNWIEENKLGE